MSKLEETIRFFQKTPPAAKDSNGMAGGSASPPIVPGCTVEAQLGSGGMGTVYLGKQLNLNRQVAIKVLGNAYAHNSRFLTQLRREAQILGELTHPNLVGCHDVIITKDGVSVIMEYIPGHLTARDAVKLLGPMPEYYVTQVLLAISQALEYAYSRGYAHCDVKPGNILIGFSDDDSPRNYDELFHSPERRIALCDFGIAALRLSLKDSDSDGSTAAPREPQEPQAYGTPLYVAPEQLITPDDIDCRSDIYALGATAYYLLTGQPPFDGSSVEDILELKAEKDIPSPRTITPQLSPELSRIVMRMGSCLPEERFQDYPSLIRAVEQQSLAYKSYTSVLKLLLYGHHRWFRRALLSLIFIAVVSLIALQRYNHWLEEHSGKFTDTASVVSRWDGAISTWRIKPMESSTRQCLIGKNGATELRLKQRIHPGERLVIRLRCHGAGRLNFGLISASRSETPLTRFYIEPKDPEGAAIGLYSLFSAGDISVPMPGRYPGDNSSNQEIELCMNIYKDHMTLLNRGCLMGTAHFPAWEALYGMRFVIYSLPPDTEVVLSRVSILK